jgi:hypothetical protein
MKGGIAIGAVGVAIGLALMLTGQHMCRTTCWVDDVFRYVLPRSLESLAGGMPWLFVGIGIIAHAILRRKK